MAKEIPGLNDPGVDNGPHRDVSPAETPHVTKYNQNWGLQAGEANDNLPGNKLNNPVALRKSKEPANGWLTIASDTSSEAENFGEGDGGEER